MDVSPNPPMECHMSLAVTKKFIKLSNGCMRLLLDNGNIVPVLHLQPQSG